MKEPLYKYEGKKVAVTCIDGQILKGRVGDYIAAEDNEPEKESIVLDLFTGGYPVEVFGEEIASIELL